MVARTHTFTIDGLHARCVTVEVDIRAGLPAFTIVGLADAAVREARERVQAAIRNGGYEFPQRRITVNLAPADLPKAGPGLDLALACALLAASGQAPRERLHSHALFGELALDGAVRACQGTLAIAQATAASGLATLVVAVAGAPQARLIEGIAVAPVAHLRSAVRVLAGGAADPEPRGGRRASDERVADPRRHPEVDLADVRGQHAAVEALVIAAAGGHNMLLRGPPGTGKTMLAQRLPSILPRLSRHEAVEVTHIRNVAGRAADRLASRRPFRAPHHSITTAGLIGGAHRRSVGEVTLAHHGVLFLDELSEFERATLDALRQPLEEGHVAIARARCYTVYPARFMLVAATNPCPCGYAGDGDRCACGEAELARHRRRLSGALLDRIDLLVALSRASASELAGAPLTSSGRARERVKAARERQAARLKNEGARTNADMDAALLRRHAQLEAGAEQMLRAAGARGLLSARGQQRVLRVARTIADLDGSARVRTRHVGFALGLRGETGPRAGRAA